MLPDSRWAMNNRQRWNGRCYKRWSMNRAMHWDSLKAPIAAAWETRQSLSPAQAPEPVRAAVEAVLDGLEAGQLRVAEPDQDCGGRVNQWLKKAVLPLAACQIWVAWAAWAVCRA